MLDESIRPRSQRSTRTCMYCKSSLQFDQTVMCGRCSDWNQRCCTDSDQLSEEELRELEEYSQYIYSL